MILLLLACRQEIELCDDLMKNLSAILMIVACALAPAALAVWENKPYDYYEIILEREPFGEPDAADTAGSQEQAAAPLPPQQSFARNLRLTALWKIEGVGVRAGIMDLQEKKNFTLGIGEGSEGIELVSADYDSETIILQMGGQRAELRMESQSGTAAPAAPSPQTARSSYLDRRRARQEAIQRPEPPEPRYTGEELRKRLQEVQMDAIRTGKPPLPIPLTPEMDRQLVEEGVLPPMEE
jgi:hypothetical protein